MENIFEKYHLTKMQMIIVDKYEHLEDKIDKAEQFCEINARLEQHTSGVKHYPKSETPLTFKHARNT